MKTKTECFQSDNKTFLKRNTNIKAQIIHNDLTTLQNKMQ